MPRKVAIPEPLPTGDKICCFCGLKDNNELEYGKIHEYDGIVTHYYCLLLSSNMQQRGNDDEGILGFLTEDIAKELRRGKRLACCYCKKSGATLGCCNTKCKRIFHFPCGLKSGSLHQFFGEFKSYCKTHRPTQKIDERVSQEMKDRDEMICYICYDEVNPRDMLGTLWAPCCKKNAWFHRPCVQQLAMSAGYFFKCPLCNNKTEFQKAMLDHGIFIPSQDASWELVPNAFEELLYRHNRCDAHKCLCPKGREHVSTNAKWELTLCRTCGSQGIHMACGSLKWVKPIWECSECTSILNKSATSGNGETVSIGRNRKEDRSPGRYIDSLTDDESSDSDISVGGFPDMHFPLAITSLSSTDSSPEKSPRSIDTQNNHNDNSAVRLSKRSDALSRSMSPTESITTSHESVKDSHSDDEFPPVPKKPRIADIVIRAEKSPAIDSDDDIIVISGPSREERTVITTNGAKSSLNNIKRFFNDSRNAENDNNIGKIEKIETPYEMPLDTSTKPEARVVKRQSSGILRPPPVEIDLSEGEIRVSESASTCETNSTANTFGDSPELNIKISNVTSLAPGAFDLVPETRNEQSIETNNFDATNSDPDSEDPIILDEKLIPKATRNNNGLYDSLHEQMTIVKFDGSENSVPTQGNSVIYGLTIPGTNHTVPFIVAPPENCKSQTPGIHPDPNNPLGIALCDCNSTRRSSVTDILNLNVFNGTTKDYATTSLAPKIAPSSSVTQKIENSQSEKPIIQTIKRSVAKTTGPQSIDAKIWSVPLKSIVKGTIPKPQSSAKTDDKTDNHSSFTKTNGSSVVSPKTAQSNATSPSTILRAIAPREKSAPVATTEASNDVVPKRFAYFSTKSSTLQNDSVSSASKTKRRIKPKNANTASTVTVAASNGPNTVWAKVNGSYVPIDPEKAKELIETTPAASILPSDKSSTAVNDPPMFQFVATDEKDRNDSSNDCDGDAGTGPAAQPASVNPTNARVACPRSPTTSFSRIDTEYETLERRNSEGNEGRCGGQEDDTPERSSSPDGSHACDRTRLINKTINLRDIKFTIGGPNIVKMTLYEIYNVNIKVDTTSGCIYEKSSDKSDSDLSTPEITRTSSLTAENEEIPIINCSDSVNTIVSLTTDGSYDTIGSHDNASLRRTSENNVAVPESISTEVEGLADSRSQDELKENRDPIPTSTNSANATNAAERKSKTRSRSGVNDHSMRSLNEKEAQEKIDESPKKVIPNETAHRVGNSTKIYYNGFKEPNETRPIVASIDTDVINPAVTRSPVNVIGNTEIMERHEVTKKRRMFVTDANSSAARDFGKSTTTNNSTNYDSAKTIVNPSIGNAKVVEIAEQFEAARRRKSGKEGNFSESQYRAKLKNSHERNKFNHTKTKQTNGSVSAAEIAQLFESARRKRTLTKDNNSTKTGEFSKTIATNDSNNRNSTKINSVVNDVKKYKRRLSDTNHVRRNKRFHANDVSHNGDTASNSEPPCCKVSIDLARIHDVLAKKLNADAKFPKINDERFANKIHEKNVSDSTLFVKNTKFLSRSRSFDSSREIDISQKIETSVVELQKSKSFENLVSLSVRYRCANGAIGIESNRTNSCKRKIRTFENHDCVR